jgi:signal recognition particle receptor subunit beta
MVFFNHATRQMTVKIVYYGPGLCGKTSNLNTIYGKTSQKARGEMVSLNTETDRTLFFDLLPMDVGMVSGFKTKLQLYTVPGQVFYNSTRKLVLKGVDGVVFVVDSQTAMLDACKESYQNLEENLRELGLNLDDIPTVFQWNKRDLRNVVPLDALEAAFNPRGTPSFQSVASDGTGVFETLRGITKLALSHIKIHVLGETHVPAAPAPEPLPPKPPPPEIEALTLSDLPSVTDLLDMEGTTAPEPTPGSMPLADDDDDSGLFIEAPVLPEPPEVEGDDLALRLEDEPLPTSAREEEDVVVSGLTGFDRAFGAESGLVPPRVAPEPVAEIQVEPAHAPLEANATGAAEPAGEPVPALPETAPVAESKLSASAVDRDPPPSKRTVKADPLAALASLKMDTKRLTAKPKAVDHRVAINSLMGELTQAGRSGQPSVLRMEVPPDTDGHELEVVVQLRSQGRVVAEGTIHHSLPGKGSTSKLSVEFKRS